MIRILQQGDDAHMNETKDDAGKLPAALDETELFLCAVADIPEAGAHAVTYRSPTINPTLRTFEIRARSKPPTGSPFPARWPT